MLCILWLHINSSTQPNSEAARDIEWLGKHRAEVQPIDRRASASLDNSTGSGFPERSSDWVASGSTARCGLNVGSTKTSRYRRRPSPMPQMGGTRAGRVRPFRCLCCSETERQ